VHGALRGEARAGERVAVNLAGTERAALGRGEVLCRPDELEPSSVIDVELTCLRVTPRPLRRGDKALFHAMTTQENAVVVPLDAGTIAPGGRAVAQIHLGQPVALLPGDRFVLRGFSVLPGHGATIGGGRVLRVRAPRRRRVDAAYAARLGAIAAAALPERLAFELGEAGGAGLARAALGALTGAGSPALDEAVAALIASGRATALAGGGGLLLDARLLVELERQALAALAALHAEAPLAKGFPRAKLTAALARRPEGLHDRAALHVLERLRGAGRISVDGELYRLAGATSPDAGSAGGDVLARVLAFFAAAGLEPPRPEEVPARLGLAPAMVRPALDRLLREGALVRVQKDYWVAAPPLAALRAKLSAHLTARGTITAQEWKALTGLSRKYAIPLAEHFDAEKLTLRVGEIRKLRPKVP
jgi:selenocysteine-specific elongation factor